MEDVRAQNKRIVSMAERNGWQVIDCFYGNGALLADGMGQHCTVSMTVMEGKITLSDPEDVVEVVLERWFVVPTPEQARGFLGVLIGAKS